MTKGTQDNTPVSYLLLSKDKEGPPMKVTWKYQLLICMLGHLQGTLCPDIFMALYQCARFDNDPKLVHEQVV